MRLALWYCLDSKLSLYIQQQKIGDLLVTNLISEIVLQVIFRRHAVIFWSILGNS